MSLCAQCGNSLPTKFVKCYACNSNYHFSSCCPLSEKTYGTMTMERKTDWRCHKCKPRKGSSSSNNAYHIIIDDCPVQQSQKQQRENEKEDEDEENDNAKRFKDSLSLSDINSSVYMVKNDVKELKTDINDIKNTVKELAITINQNNMQINTNLQTALAKITDTLSTLTTQVNELCESNKEKDKQIKEMDTRINDLEQQLLNKNIEIKNITNENIHPNEVVKTIANSINVVINDNDISNSYMLKRSQKVIVEFTTQNKKRELLSKISRHRVDSSVINNNNDNNNKFIYINEHLTPYKRRLLWLTKTKARETNWKFVWVKNGNIYAKKNEISNPILIKNNADIELITSAI